MAHLLLIRRIASVSLPRSPQNLCKFGERVRNTAKKEDWFTAATNGRVHVSTLITTMYLRLWIPLTLKVSKHNILCLCL